MKYFYAICGLVIMALPCLAETEAYPARQLELLNSAETPPFQLDEHTSVGEDVRLHYRYMDLRRPEMQNRLILRSRISTAVRIKV